MRRWWEAVWPPPPTSRDRFTPSFLLFLQILPLGYHIEILEYRGKIAGLFSWLK